MNFNKDEKHYVTTEDYEYLKNLKEKKIQEVQDCELLGSTKEEGGGGLIGRWEAKKFVKIAAAKSRADTVVFGPEPKWEISKTFVSGSFFRCHRL